MTVRWNIELGAERRCDSYLLAADRILSLDEGVGQQFQFISFQFVMQSEEKCRQTKGSFPFLLDVSSRHRKKT